MLVLSRKKQESVVVGGANGSASKVTVTIVSIHGSQVQLGFDVDVQVPVHRFEVWERINRDDQLTRQLESPLVPLPDKFDAAQGHVN